MGHKLGLGSCMYEKPRASKRLHPDRLHTIRSDACPGYVCGGAQYSFVDRHMCG
jgi:hypothetical protein